MDKITENANIYLNLQGLSDLKALARSDSSKALDAVAEQFESIFVRMMLKSMRQASMGDPLLDSEATKLYQSMMDDQLALDFSKKGTFGIAEQLVEQLSRYVQPSSPPEVTPASVQAEKLSQYTNVLTTVKKLSIRV